MPTAQPLSPLPVSPRGPSAQGKGRAEKGVSQRRQPALGDKHSQGSKGNEGERQASLLSPP